MSDGEPRMHATPIGLIEWLGFELGVDLDDTLMITSPAEIRVDQIVYYLRQCEQDVDRLLRRRAVSQRNQFVGGPLNGKLHWNSGVSHWHGGGATIVRRVGPRNWAVYRLQEDGRAFYVGQATSEKKAKLLAANAIAPKPSPDERCDGW